MVYLLYQLQEVIFIMVILSSNVSWNSRYEAVETVR